MANRADSDGFLIRNTTSGALTFHVDDIRLIGVPVPSQLLLTVNPQNVGRVIDNRFGWMTEAPTKLFSATWWRSMTLRSVSSVCG